MPVKTKENGNRAGESQPKTDLRTATETGLSVEPTLITDPDSFTTEVSSALGETDAVDEAADVDGSLDVDVEGGTTLATPPVPALIQLSTPEAISAINTANHDLITLLEPLLKSPVTQKRLTELMVSRIGLPKDQADSWAFHVSRLLETKQQASQSLVRSLIADS